MLFALMVLISVALALAGAYLLWTPSRAQARVQDLAADRDSASWTQTVVRIAGPLARLSAPDQDWEASPLRVRFFHAGIRQAQAQHLYFAAKTLLPVVLGLAAYLALAPMGLAGLDLALALVSIATLGCYLPNLFLAIRVRRRQREILDNFAEAADLLLVCVEAGLGLDAGLAKVADEMRLKCLPLAEELHLTLLEMRAGASREKALHGLAARTGVEELRTFSVMLVQADKFGTSIGESLRVFSDDLRTKRQTRAEETAAKIPTKMLIPLVIFIFPSIIMVILGPALIQIVRTVLPTIAGTR